MLVAFRARVSGRLRSEVGVQSLMKMVRLVPSVSISSGSSRPANGKLSRTQTAPSLGGTSAWGSILDTQGSVHCLLDSKGDDILDSAFCLAPTRPPLSPLTPSIQARPWQPAHRLASESVLVPLGCLCRGAWLRQHSDAASAAPRVLCHKWMFLPGRTSSTATLAKPEQQVKPGPMMLRSSAQFCACGL